MKMKAARDAQITGQSSTHAAAPMPKKVKPGVNLQGFGAIASYVDLSRPKCDRCDDGLETTCANPQILNTLQAVRDA